PEFRGARAQWNFTDHLVKPQQFLNGFKAPLHLHYIKPTLLCPSCGSSRAVLEKSSSRSTSDNITIRDIHFHSCRASLRMNHGFYQSVHGFKCPFTRDNYIHGYHSST